MRYVRATLVVCSALLCATFIALVPIDRVYRQRVVYGQPIDPSTGRRWILSAAMDRDGLALEADRDQRVHERYKPLVGWHAHSGRYPSGVGGFISTWGRGQTRLGFAWSDYESKGHQHGGLHVVTSRMRRVVIPYWFLIATTAIAPLVTLRRVWRLRRRRAENQCAACGYDLRATPECCPECGTVQALAGASP